ncbi:MAG: hypothetical protein ACM30I_16615, partial [Gemmatimonas sp.]
MRRLHPNPAPLPPAECRRRSRIALERRVIAATIWSGHSLATIERTPHMPRACTVEAWIARDAAFRTRYERAVAERHHVVGDELRRAADAAWERARSPRERVRALRMMLGVAKWLVTSEAAARQANGAGAQTSAKAKGLTAAMAALLVETLNKAHAARKAKAEQRAKAPNGDGPDAKAEAVADAMDAHLSASPPRPSLQRTDGVQPVRRWGSRATDSASQCGALDSRLRGNDEEKEEPAQPSSPPLPACGERVGVRGNDSAGGPPPPPPPPPGG